MMQTRYFIAALIVMALTAFAPAGEPNGGEKPAPAIGLIASTLDETFSSIGGASINAAGRVIFDANGTSIYKWENDSLELLLSMFAAGISSQQRDGEVIVMHGKATGASDPLTAFTLNLETDELEEINTGPAGIAMGQFSIDESGGISFWKLGECVQGQCVHLILENATPADPEVLASANGGEVLFAPVRDPDGSATLYVRSLSDGSMQLRIAGEADPVYATAPGGVVSAPSIAGGLVAIFINDPDGVLGASGVYTFELGKLPTTFELAVNFDGSPLSPTAHTRPAINEHGDLAFSAIDQRDGLEKIYLLAAGANPPEVLLSEGDEVEVLGGIIRQGLQILGLSDDEIGSEQWSGRVLFRAVVGPTPSEAWTVLGDVGSEIHEPKDPVDPEPCPADVTGDGHVNIFDLLAVLAAWGDCPDPEDCPADVTGDATVNIFDLLAILSAWGECPE